MSKNSKEQTEQGRGGQGREGSKGQTPKPKDRAGSKVQPEQGDYGDARRSTLDAPRPPGVVRWFASSTVRHASAMRKHVRKLLNHQRDILSPQAVENISAANDALGRAIADGADKPALEEQMQRLEDTAGKWLKPYPNAAWRENIEVLLVALTVAMGIRTFLLQPFKIPTGSMQPTLFGVTSDDLLRKPNFKIPTGLERVKQWFEGISYIHVVADNDGTLDRVEEPLRLLIFNIKQTRYIGAKPYTIWFPPDYGSGQEANLPGRAHLQPGHYYHTGEDVVRLKVQAGDHLFVDRLSYNFRPPERGEIIVFETKGIQEDRRMRWGIPGDQFYIKRLVGLGGERLQIGADRHLIINGKRLDASTPHFENVYSFNPNAPPQVDHYSGHTMQGSYVQEHLAGVQIPKNEYMVMGDNTENSLDSRYWGPFPNNYVIGKSFFVYWPITERFGWGYYR